jgi:demethylmenaquinone methyltransferase/2-methoxy-6-polyprenyl-1,4-benzoquinol methylase
VKAYYDRRAPEYDEWWQWHVEEHGPEVDALLHTIAAMPSAHTLDIACGTGFLTRHLTGEITGIDQSESMLEIARAQMPAGRFVLGDALALPFENDEFDRVFTGHFYGHLNDEERRRFLDEAKRVARELVVVDSAVRPDSPRESMQERTLKDGSRWEVLKRYFTPEQLAAELGGGRTLFAGRWFVAVASPA